MKGAVLLAGGLSRRMGADKATLRLGGVTLLEHVTRQLVAAGAHVVVVARPEQALPQVGAEIVRDDPHIVGQGPLVGLAAGLRRLAQNECELAYLTGVDAAWLTTSHVAWMFSELEATPNVDALVPCDVSARSVLLHPLASAVRVGSASRVAQALVDHDERRATALVDALPHKRILRVALPEPLVLESCNEPKELERAELWWAKRAHRRDGVGAT